jgi:hypothetical protein
LLVYLLDWIANICSLEITRKRRGKVMGGMITRLTTSMADHAEASRGNIDSGLLNHGVDDEDVEDGRGTFVLLLSPSFS